MKLDTLTVLDIQNILDKLKSEAEKDNSFKLVFHPSVITYDLSIARTWEQYKLRNKKNRIIYHTRKAFWYDVNQVYWNFLDRIH